MTDSDYVCSDRGQQYELLDWLAEITFPMESRFQDVNFARKVYPSVVRRIIDSGVSSETPLFANI